MGDINFKWTQNEYETISIGVTYSLIGDETEVEKIIAIWEWVSDDGIDCSLPIPATHPIYADSDLLEMVEDKINKDLYERG